MASSEVQHITLHGESTDIPSTNDKTFVSIVIPCRSERNHLRAVLDSIISQDYTRVRLEVLVVDGMSEDGTREIVKEFSHRWPIIRLLDNPKRTTPAALNIGIQQARGDIIVRMDAHTTYAKDYVSECVKALSENEGDVVGGIWKVLPDRDTVFGRAVASAWSHPFGVCNAYYKSGYATQQMPVETVPFGSYRRQLFERIGLFDERLPRSEDVDFYRRVKAAGGKILLIPSIVSYYRIRSTFSGFSKHCLQNGFLVTYYLKFGKIAFFWRHLVPLVFVATLLVTTALVPVHPVFWWLLVSLLGAYVVANIVTSFWVAIARKDFHYLTAMPIVFAIIHWGYGLGSLYGLVRALASATLWRRLANNWRLFS